MKRRTFARPSQRYHASVSFVECGRVCKGGGASYRLSTQHEDMPYICFTAGNACSMRGVIAFFLHLVMQDNSKKDLG